MSPSSSLLFTFTILFCSLHSFVRANRLIQQTCKNCSKTDPNISYKFCVTSFQSDHRSHYAKTLQELGLISIKIIRHNVTDTNNHINELLKKEKSLDPFIKECLDDCLEVYSDTVSTFREAIRDYKAKRYADCNVKLSSIIDASTTCEDGFKQKNDSISPLTKRNKDTFQLSAIALSIVNMLISADKLEGAF
ncbi:putative invertase inhibitor [Cajanus cajan]|uniref:Invertase inhibitor n=1 Tax=Cajanus cajan TaxID=3821 RepID=A0A151SYS6_CAJCA|nr:putative invertase inhibitor [Cajanus cajan]KYP59943.1 Putative invertase inhibitor [Cajanus cajan]